MDSVYLPVLASGWDSDVSKGTFALAGVYATCSLLKQENQDVVEAFLANHPDFEIMDATEVLAKQGVNLPDCAKSHAPYFVMAPHQSGTDGFFGAVLVRKDPQAS